MNIIERIQAEVDGFEARVSREREQLMLEKEGAEHLPVEIQQLDSLEYCIHYHDKSYRLVYSDPIAWKTLKMAGVTGLKRVFGGRSENDWCWEGGKLVCGEYEYDVDIQKADRPVSCRLEEHIEMVPVKKLVAICPETMEPYND